MSDVMCCARCGNALKIVCPEHGTEFVPDLRMAPPGPQRAKQTAEPLRRGAAMAPAAPPTTTRTSAPVRREVLADRIVRAMRDATPGTQWTTDDVCRQFGISAAHAGVEFSKLVKVGRIARVTRGRYVLDTP